MCASSFLPGILIFFFVKSFDYIELFLKLNNKSEDISGVNSFDDKKAQHSSLQSQKGIF